MRDKMERHRAILEIVVKNVVATQAELKQLLKVRGFPADQATLSRDIRELGLVKTAEDGVHPHYATVEAVIPPITPRATAVLARLVKKVDVSGNLLVLKTDPGEAGPVAIALDRLGWAEVLGTVAGDDTLLVIVREGASSKRLARKILDLKQKQRRKKDTA